MDLYISKKCQHCGQLLMLLKENPNLQPYFIIKAIEDYPYPKELKVVPTLIKNNQLYSGKELNDIINDVNRFDMKSNGHIQKSQQLPEQQHPPLMQNISNKILDERELELQKYKEPYKQPQQQIDNNNGDIMGICDSEGCMFESIDNTNNNSLIGEYCFLEEGYKENNLNNNNNNNSSNINKSTKFDNNAYEELMKNRG
jgi:hypothetical protein